jgi:hypothetical protein
MVYAQLRGHTLSKFAVSPILEIGVVAAGMIFVVIITIIAHSSTTSYSVADFDAWELRPAIDPMGAPEVKTLAEYPPSAPKHAWEE